MSISKLNDQLKADICSFLDFKDINKLAQVNKSIKASLQRRALDKPEVHRLCFEEQYPFYKWVCFFDLHRDSEYPNKRTTVAEMELDEDMNSTEVLNCINKFIAIEVLSLNDILLQDNSVWEDIDAKIRSVELDHCKITMSKETVMKFFKKFELVRILYGSTMNPAYITDELFIELARNGTTVNYKSYIEQVVALTDVTLDALSRRRIPDKLYLMGLITGITIERVKKMIEDAFKTEMTQIRYNFGYLKSDQYNESHHFMSEEFERWAEGFDRSLNYENDEMLDYESYTIYNDDRSIYIEFSVYKPNELLQNDNLGEEESSDETDDEAANLLGNLEI